MAGILSVVMLVSPIFVVLQAQMGHLLLVVYAPTWMFSPSPYMPFYISPFLLLTNFPLYGFKIVFVYFIYKCYSADKTKKTTIRVGILSEITPVLIFMLPYLIIMLISPYPASPPFVIPIPILFILGYVILKKWPPPEPATWIESDTEQMWWDREESEPPSESKDEDIWP
jgi:hypothetical protein